MSRIKVIRNFIRHTAEKLENGVALTPEETQYWVSRLYLIADGCPPDIALNLRRRVGETVTKEAKREKISLVLHLVASLHKPLINPALSPKQQTQPLTLTEAIVRILPEVPKIMGDGGAYDFEQVKSWWYDPDKQHMQSQLRSLNDRDDPYSM
jgi:hypothetical protein